MIAATDIGQLVVFVMDGPIDESAVPPAGATIDASSARTCHELERKISADIQDRNIVILNLLEPFYDASIPTREAAQVLGRVKSALEGLVENGAQVAVVCRRRSEDLGTRSHFLASLCASADHVHFLKST